MQKGPTSKTDVLATQKPIVIKYSRELLLKFKDSPLSQPFPKNTQTIKDVIEPSVNSQQARKIMAKL